MHVLYCGDTTHESAASSHLGGLLHRGGIQYGYIASDESLPRVDLHNWNLLILSDYPASRISERLQLEIVDRIEAGAGLLMIGGNRSFRGKGGYWNDTPLGRLLPVEIGAVDDRLNCDRPLIAKSVARHSIVDELPWETRPPLISGLNQVACKAEDDLLLSVERFEMKWTGGIVEMEPIDVFPLLAVGHRRHGRVAAFMSDIAPPWGGPLIEWGTERIRVEGHRTCARGHIEMPAIDVGDLYAEFVTRLALWTMGRL